MRILPPFEERIRHSIRDELAKKPMITVTALQEQLEKEYGRDFHFSYLRKLVGKVRNEIVHDVDRATIEPRLAELRENYRLMREEPLKIVYWNPETAPQGVPTPLARDRVEAAKSVVIARPGRPQCRGKPPACSRSPSTSSSKSFATTRYRTRCAP